MKLFISGTADSVLFKCHGATPSRLPPPTAEPEWRRRRRRHSTITHQSVRYAILCLVRSRIKLPTQKNNIHVYSSATHKKKKKKLRKNE